MPVIQLTHEQINQLIHELEVAIARAEGQQREIASTIGANNSDMESISEMILFLNRMIRKLRAKMGNVDPNTGLYASSEGNARRRRNARTRKNRKH